MSNTNDKHPGQGFTPVGGYNPPAGSQAEQIKRAEEASRKAQQDAHNRNQRQQQNSPPNSGGGGCIVLLFTLGLSFLSLCLFLFSV